MSAADAAALRTRLAELISAACDGEVSAARIAQDPDAALAALGVGSLARLRLIDAIEDEFGLLVEADEIFEALESLSVLAGWLGGRLEQTR
ncbi:MAG: phosphopantetheine-binding protein [Actinocrinis sp.]